MNLKIGLELIYNDGSVRLLVEESVKMGTIDLYCDHFEDEDLINKEVGVVDVTMDTPMAKVDNDEEEDDHVVHEEAKSETDIKTEVEISDPSDDDGDKDLIKVRQQKIEIKNAK